MTELYQTAPFTRIQLERALDSHRLEVQWANGNFNLVRRNGRTQTWKRTQHMFRIPCKTGLRYCFTIGDESQANIDHKLDSPFLRIRMEP